MQEAVACEPAQLAASPSQESPVRTAIKALYRKGDIIEVRAWDKDTIYTGRYKYGTKLVRMIEFFDAEGCDVYTVLNPVGEKLGLRDMGEGGRCTWEQGVPWRRWFLLDFDPRRKHKIATDEQFRAALVAAKDAKEWLEASGWRGIVLASSGNGAHLDIPCGLPNDAPSKEMVRRVQRVVSGKFSSQQVEVECFPDANRLVRAYGTTNKKGDETASLKHRPSAILEAASGACNPRDIMEKILAENPVAGAKAIKNAGRRKGPFTRDTLEERLEAWRQGWEGPDGEEFDYEDCGRLDGFRIWCPGNFADGWPDGETHGDIYESLNDSTIVWVENGLPNFSCRHAHCGEGAEHGKKTWLDLQNYYDPERRLHRIRDDANLNAKCEEGYVEDGVAAVGEAGTEDALADPAEAHEVVAAADPQQWWVQRAKELDETRKAVREDEEGKKYRIERHIVEEEVWAKLIETLKEKCDFLHDAYPYLFVREEGLLVSLHDELESVGFLGDRLRLRATQAHTEFALENLHVHAMRHGPGVELGHWGLFQHGKVYVNNGRGGIIKVSAEAIEEVRNGTDDVYLHGREVMPWPKVDAQPHASALAAVRQTLGGKGLMCGRTPLAKYLGGLFQQRRLGSPQYLQILMARYLGLFFRGAFSLLPICFAIGEKGSGKTTLFEKMAWLVLGTGYEAGAMPRDVRGLVAALTNNHMAVFDNCDRTKWMEDNKLDYICKASTGGRIPIAVLYKTNSVASYSLRCDQFFTARSNSWPDGATDAARRTLLFPLRIPSKEEQVDREEWMRDLMNNRDAYLIETLARLQLCVRALAASGNKRYAKKSGMQEFETWTMRIADAEGWAKGMEAIWAGYMEDSSGVIIENSPFVTSMRLWVGSIEGTKAITEGQWVKAGDIYRVLKPLLDKSDLKQFAFGHESRLGVAMMDKLDILRDAFGVELKFTRGHNWYKFNPSEAALAESKQAYRAALGVYDDDEGEGEAE